ncbi:hypothetical protein [Cryobacterium sp. Sr3]|uniref:hypothetical protein n=1 Tax=Cryobacterium sp. Sr3 TaxID=1259194 RepID=UPI001068FDCC|nr:hypothetical protein [Cryobacterium sp. Sr3]TFB59621.1 hypothetical protein E3N94_03175 [Cryobacterium sp. Sr3]
MRKFTVTVFCAAAISVAITGCSANGTSGPSLTGEELWALDIADAKARASSIFEQGVFADDNIERSEYSESMQRYISCVQQGGFPNAKLTGPDSDGLYVEQSSTPATASDADFRAHMDAYVEVSQSCAKGTTLLVASLYADQKRNPQHEDYSDMVVKCLIAGEYVDPSYTPGQFDAESTPDEASKGLLSSASFDMSDPGVQACLNDPYTDA